MSDIFVLGSMCPFERQCGMTMPTFVYYNQVHIFQWTACDPKETRSHGNIQCKQMQSGSSDTAA